MKSFPREGSGKTLLLLFLWLTAVTCLSATPSKPVLHANFQVSLTCPDENPAGTFVTMQNDQDSSLVYHGLTDHSGHCLIINLQPGQYSIHIDRLNYEPYFFQSNITINLSINLTLQQVKKKPTGVHVNKLDLKAQWRRPTDDSTYFFEDWSSGSFATNGWTITGGTNWLITTAYGNPSPCADFNWYPQVLNYSQLLTSRVIPAPCSPRLNLSFDFNLSGYACTTVQTLAVEVWNVSSWVRLWYADTYSGNYPWTTMNLDITKYAGKDILFRFNSTGEDSYDINYWLVDNIRITGSSGSAPGMTCVSGYKVFLNNSQIGTTTGLTYPIPPSMVQYGTPAQFCVRAVYPNGDSPPGCTTFTPEYLYPPGNLAGQFQMDSLQYRAHLTWEKPKKADGTTPAGITGYKIYREDEMVHQAASPNTLTWDDINPLRDTIDYRITAVYDLAGYGSPGQTGESLPAGPAAVFIDPGYDTLLPLVEGWTQGSFEPNHWSQDPPAGRWTIDNTAGYPPPGVKFTGAPADTAYSYSLVSPWIDLTGWNCSNLFMRFYYAKAGQAASYPTLAAEVNNNRQWIPLLVAGNNSSADIFIRNISFLQDSWFRFRFRVYGSGPSPGAGWTIDNVHLYGQCPPPTKSHLHPFPNGITLDWSPPGCYSSGKARHLNYSNITANTSIAAPPVVNEWYGNRFLYWESPYQLIIREIELGFQSDPDHGGDCLSLDIYDKNHHHLSSTDSFVPPDSGWITVPVNSVMVSDSFFYVMVHWNSTAHATSRLGLCTTPGGDLCPAVHFDGTTWQNITVPSNSHPTFLIHVKGIILDYPWDNPSGNPDPGAQESPAYCCVGYNIFRSGEAGAFPYAKVNPSMISVLSYTDTLTGEHNYGYYVESVFMDSVTGKPFCSRPGDTLYSAFPVGMKEYHPGCKTYPDPATDELVAECNSPMRKICLFDNLGRRILEFSPAGERRYRLPLRGLSPGIYIIKVLTDNYSTSTKIIKQ